MMKPEVNLTQEAKSVLVGTLLGDGCLAMNSCGPRVNPQFIIRRSIKDEEYLVWQHKVLADCGLVKAPVKYYQHYDQRYNKTYYTCYLYSGCYPILWEFYNMFYPDERTKVVTSDILKLVNPLALAVWYMDDGSLYKGMYRHKGTYRKETYQLRLHTQGFTVAENKLIQDWFLDRWRVRVTLEPSNGNGFLVAVNKQAERNKFLDIVRPFIILPCMSRKLPEYS